MKSFKIIIIALLVFTFKTNAQQIKSIEMQVTGLTCSMCSQATEKSVRSLTFVADVKPDLNKNLFLVTFKSAAAVDVDLLQKKVEDAGFFVGNLRALINFKNVKINDNGLAIADGRAFQFIKTKAKTLNGDMQVTFLDKKFISSKAFKENSKAFKLASYTNGVGLVAGKKSRIYHVSI